MKGLGRLLGFLFPLAGSVGVVHSATFSDWQAEKFTLEELADPQISGPTADPDGDGISNFWEYAFDLNPMMADSAASPQVGVANGHLTLTHRRRILADDLSCWLQASDDLNFWITPNNVLTTNAAEFATYRLLTLQDPALNA